MTTQLEKAKSIMQDGALSLSLQNDGKSFTSDSSGISPLLSLLATSPDLLLGASVSDKVVGRAAAMLFTLGKVKEIYAEVISQPALDVLEKHGIPIEYNTLVPLIRNRSGEGLCPMESSVMFVDSPERAYEILTSEYEKIRSRG